jgi:hypothetical protein
MLHTLSLLQLRSCCRPSSRVDRVSELQPRRLGACLTVYGSRCADGPSNSCRHCQGPGNVWDQYYAWLGEAEMTYQVTCQWPDNIVPVCRAGVPALAHCFTRWLLCKELNCCV